MWAKVESNSVTKIYTRPTAITVGNINHPQNIMQIWSEAELKGIGIYEITVDTTNLKDNEYYKNTDITYTYNSGADTVIGTYGTSTAKPLIDSLYTAEDESNGLGTEGDIKQQGLKTIKKININTEASGYLSQYDWYTLRAASGGTAIPSAIATYQTAVRTKSNEHQVAIDAAANVDALAALTFDWPAEPS